ncbi:MAG: glycosyltransferase family 4 protein [Ilumatobacteraceae bacterium]
MSTGLRVAYTLEQCWHDVPGGTAIAALEVHRRLLHRSREIGDIEVVAVAGRHRRPPVESYRPHGDVRMWPIARPWLYESWNRLDRPSVESATGAVDVCHSTVAIPAPSAAPSVVTVHDVAFVRTPERFTRHGVRVMRRGLDRCRDAERVICPSRATADELIELGFDPGRIRVVPWGVERRAVHPADRARVSRRYSLPSTFVLFVGTVEPRKNLGRLVAAMRALPDVPLVLAGASGWGDGLPDQLADHLPDPVSGARVLPLGFVPADDLRPIIELASVVAYPSLEEGFGLPILEAMAHGTPVVTSNRSSMVEVAGGAAVLADPHDVDSIAEAVRVALDDRDRWAQRGLERAASCSWERTVESTIDVYREVVR